MAKTAKMQQVKSVEFLAEPIPGVPNRFYMTVTIDGIVAVDRGKSRGDRTAAEELKEFLAHFPRIPKVKFTDRTVN